MNYRILLALVIAFAAPVAWGADAVAQSYPPVIQCGDGYVRAVTIDAAGNRYAVGFFYGGPWDFNPGIGIDARSSAGGTDVFVTRFNADGTYGWTETFGGTSYEEGLGIAVSGSTVYATGSFQSSDAGVGGVGSLASSGNSDAFVLALDTSTGAALSGFGTGGAQKFGGTNNDWGYDIAVSGPTVYVTGSFASSNAGVGGTGNLASSGGDAFVLALNASTGAALSGFGADGAQKFGGSSYDEGRGIAVSGSTLYATGFFRSSNAGVGVTGSYDSTGFRGFLLPLDAATGAFAPSPPVINDAVAQSYPPVIQGHVTAVAMDAAGNRYVTGYFIGARDFNPGVGADEKSSGGISADVFVTRYNADGTYAWTQKFGGTSEDYAAGIAVSGNAVYVTGQFTSTDAQIGGAGPVISSSDTDAFLLALNPQTGAALSAFGQGGVQVFGGNSYDGGYGVAVSGSTVYFTGFFYSSSAGIGVSTDVVSEGGADVFIAALDAATGAPKPSFGSGGVQTFGGDEDDIGQSIAVTDSAVYVAGYFTSSNAGVGGAGGFADAGDGDVFVLPLNPITGTPFSNFGLGGIQTFGGTGGEYANAIAISGSTVYVAGMTYSQDAGVGGLGNISTSGNADAFVLALNAQTGAAVSGFGTGGVQTFGGSEDELANDLAVDGLAVYVAGHSNSSNAGVGGTGNLASVGGVDAFALALNATTGAALSDFGASGVQRFGGTGEDHAQGIALHGSKVYLAGQFQSLNAGVNGTGNYSASNFGGFLLELDTVPVEPQPSITSVSPSEGPYTGGQSVTITGTNLDGATSVTFGGAAAAITSNTATQIVVTTPPHAVGGVDVSVTTPGGSTTLARGSFQPPVPYSVSIDYPFTGDFNGDGKTDRIALQFLDYPAILLVVMLSNGDGTFQTGASYHIREGVYYSTLAIGDLNADGKLDLVIGNTFKFVTVMLGNGDGTFGTAVKYRAGDQLNSIIVTDVNGDGRSDVVVREQDARNDDITCTVEVFLADAGGTLWSSAKLAAKYPGLVAVGDFNGDGRPDLIIPTDPLVNASVYLGNGDGTFQAAVTTAVGSHTNNLDLDVGDFDGDDKLDFAIASGFSPYTVRILLGNGDGSFEAAIDIDAGEYLQSLHVADVNGDGKPDLIVDYNYGRGTSVLLGNGSVYSYLPGLASTLGVTGFPSLVAPGDASTFRVAAKDSDGNTATNYTGTIHFTSSDPAAKLPLNYTFTPADHGTHSFSAQLFTLGAQSITATDTANANIKGTQTPIIVGKITSALTLQGRVGNQFNYLATAGGGSFSDFSFTPVNFSSLASIGLAFDPVTHVLSGVPTKAGSFLVTLTATVPSVARASRPPDAANASGRDARATDGSISAVVKINISRPGTNKQPAVSTLSVKNNPALMGVPVNFSLNARDPDGDVLSITWNFGDGAALIGSAVVHTYTIGGEYPAFVVVTDGTSVVKIETPVSVIATDGLTITQASLHFKLPSPPTPLPGGARGADTIALTGFIPVTPGQSWAGTTVQIQTGATMLQTFTLNKKGAALLHGSQFAFRKLPRGATTFDSSPAKFQLALKNKSFFSAFNDADASPPFTNANIPRPGVAITIPLTITFDGATYTTGFTVKYTATANKSGAAVK